MIPDNHDCRVDSAPATAPVKKSATSRPRGGHKKKAPMAQESVPTSVETPTIQAQERRDDNDGELELKSEFIKKCGSHKDPGGFRP